MVRAYHGDHIKEKQFKKWYLPALLPDVRTNKDRWPEDLGEKGNIDADSEMLERYAGRKRLEKIAELEESVVEMRGLPPVDSLMFSEVERRVDVLIFRACFTQNVWEARRLVTHGHVKINGVQVCLPSLFWCCSTD